MQGCNLLESGTDLKASFFFSFVLLLCLKFSKYATAECELSFVVLAITSQPYSLFPLLLGKDRTMLR